VPYLRIGIQEKTVILGHAPRRNIFPELRWQWARFEAVALLALMWFATCSVALAQQVIKTGPEVGSTLPRFEARDQNGRLQNFKSILGPKGALLVFFRSADW